MRSFSTVRSELILTAGMNVISVLSAESIELVKMSAVMLLNSTLSATPRDRPGMNLLSLLFHISVCPSVGATVVISTSERSPMLLEINAVSKSAWLKLSPGTNFVSSASHTSV